MKMIMDAEREESPSIKAQVSISIQYGRMVLEIYNIETKTLDTWVIDPQEMLSAVSVLATNEAIRRGTG